jgi:hypothetical protein
MVSLSLLVLGALAVALPVLISRRARLGRINVFLQAGEGEPYGVLGAALSSLGGESEAGPEGTLHLYRSSQELPPGERDVIVAPAQYGSDRDRLVAVDPYLLTLDRRAGTSPLQEPGNNLSDLTAWLGSLDTGARTPFVIAGEREQDFAAFILYLSGELLGQDARESLLGELRNASLAARGERAPTEAMAGDVEAIEALLEELTPVLDHLAAWKEAEILAFNWTNWDRIALEQSIRDAQAAVAFHRRSELESLSWEEKFHLRVRLPPVGPSRRLYSMVGYGISVTSGEGPRADAAEAVTALLRNPGTQEAIESETAWSPVALEGTPINREHRDVVRWVAGAQEYLLLEPAVVEHPLFRRTHQLLR